MVRIFGSQHLSERPKDPGSSPGVGTALLPAPARSFWRERAPPPPPSASERPAPPPAAAPGPPPLPPAIPTCPLPRVAARPARPCRAPPAPRRAPAGALGPCGNVAAPLPLAGCCEDRAQSAIALGSNTWLLRASCHGGIHDGLDAQPGRRVPLAPRPRGLPSAPPRGGRQHAQAGLGVGGHEGKTVQERPAGAATEPPWTGVGNALVHNSAGTSAGGDAGGPGGTEAREPWVSAASLGYGGVHLNA